MKLLKSFEDFIFEAASWLIFYPLTLGRIMLHPLKTMEYSDREQTEDTDHRYDAATARPAASAGLAKCSILSPPPRDQGLSEIYEARPLDQGVAQLTPYSGCRVSEAIPMSQNRAERITGT